MRWQRSASRVAVAAVVIGLACGRSPGDPALQVRRGDLTATLLLTGELEAASSERFFVPQTPSWQIQLRWLADDGAPVTAGDRVAEYDSGDLVQRRADAELRLAQADDERARQAAQAAQAGAERRFAVEEARTRLAAAELDAAVPAELLPARQYQERQLALARARAQLDKAVEAEQAWRVQAEADRALVGVDRERAERARSTAESALAVLVARAPRPGVFVVGRHPWEPRRLQVGDVLQPGVEVGAIPDLSTLRVRAALFDVDRDRVQLGATATCALDAFPAEAIPCTVSEISPVAREPERLSLRRAFTVRLALARFDAERMRPGQSVKVAVVTESQAGVLLAPRAGLELASEPVRARLAGGDLREVRLGPCAALECVVETGLTEGEHLEQVHFR